MIVGTTEVPIEELKVVVNGHSDIVEYAVGLVPTWARHVRGIVNNQRYYVAVLLRNITSIPYKVRQPLIEKLLNGIALTGLATNVCSITDIIEMCDKELLTEALKRGREL